MIKPSLLYDLLYLFLLIVCLILTQEKYSHLLSFSIPSAKVIVTCLLVCLIYLFLANLNIGSYEAIFLTFFRFSSVYPVVVFSLFYSESLTALYFSFVFYTTLHALLKIPFSNVTIKWAKVFSKRAMIACLLLISGFMVLVIFVNNGLPSLDAFNYKNIYKVRDEYNGGALIALLQSFTTFFIVPFLIFKLRGAYSFILPFALGLLIFLSSGGKFILAMCLVFFGLKFILKYFSVRELPLIFIGPVFCALIALQTEYDFLAHFLFFRPFIMPAWITYEYFDFANVVGFYHYNDHFFTGLFAETIDVPISVGWQMFPNSGSYVNTGSIGYSYFNMGWFPFIEVGFIVVIVKSFSYIGRNSLLPEDKSLVIAMLVVLGIYIGTTNILTALKTRMFLAALLAIFLSVKRKRYE